MRGILRVPCPAGSQELCLNVYYPNVCWPTIRWFRNVF